MWGNEFCVQCGHFLQRWRAEARSHCSRVSGRLYSEDMSALQDDQPRFLLCVVDDPWTPEERRELHWGYEAGMDIPLLSKLLDYTPREVVRELSRQIFDIPTPSEDRKSTRYGSTWTTKEINFLIESFQMGRKPVSIAVEIGRDELGVCWQLIVKCRPAIEAAR